LNYDDSGLAAERIFNVKKEYFLQTALELANFQFRNNAVYRKFCSSRGMGPIDLHSPMHDIPFLPVGFFKSHDIKTFARTPEKIFTSSGTTGTTNSRHFVRELSIYEQSFELGFQYAYGHPAKYAFLCLLPSYLEREGSSLIYMAERLQQLSGQADSGYFLNHREGLVEILEKREAAGQPSILLGVTHALLDFAEQHPMALAHTIVMETGGMKGRRKEMVRAELHEVLQQAFQVDAIHSEYGMTELLSQAYSKKDGRFTCPPWMKVMVRSDDDPGELKEEGTGLICIADLANVYSCSFIETEDVGKLYTDGSFEVLGRLDNSDIRGCSLLAL
jgi:phenylacetate-coenzyme A ligase PaaK-like adenylate-forming protein